MRNDELNVALEKYFDSEISERTKELEICRTAAFEIWNKICEIYTNFSPRVVKLFICGCKTTLKYNFKEEEIYIDFPYNNSSILKFISIIAECSDVKGKVFAQADGLTFIFPYK